MALTPVEQVRFLIGLGPNSPFYQYVSDQEIEWALEQNDNNIYQAARLVAVSLSFELAGVSTRERTGDIEVWNSVSTTYLAALNSFIRDPNITIPRNLMPWSSSIRLCNLTKIETCDGDSCRDACEDNCSCPKCGAGETF